MAIVAVAAVLGIGAVSSGEAQSGVTANLEVRVWQNVRDDLDISISARPQGWLVAHPWNGRAAARRRCQRHRLPLR